MGPVSLKLCRRIALFALPMLLASCSAVQLSYNNADLWVRWKADSYFDLRPPQEAELRVRVARFHDWHRTHELPQYAELMRSAAKRLEDGLSDQDIAWAVENVRARYRALVVQAIADSAPLVVTLSSEQLAHLRSRFAEDNRKFSKQFLSDSEEKRVEAREKRLEEWLSDWIGDLTREQEQRVAAMVSVTPDRAATRLAERIRDQREFVEILKSEPNPETLVPRLTDLMENWEARRSREQVNEDKLVETQFYRMLLDLDRSLTPAQRAHAVRRFQRYAADFAELAAQTGRSEASAWSNEGAVGGQSTGM
jgi:hypothetical protein